MFHTNLPAVRFGRIPKREKQRLLDELHNGVATPAPPTKKSYQEGQSEASTLNEEQEAVTTDVHQIASRVPLSCPHEGSVKPMPTHSEKNPDPSSQSDITCATPCSWKGRVLVSVCRGCVCQNNSL